MAVICRALAEETEKEGVFRIAAHPGNWNYLIRSITEAFIRLCKFLGVSIGHNYIWRINVRRKATELIKKRRPDWIITTFPTLSSLEVGLYLNKRFHIPLISDFRDGLLFEPAGHSVRKRKERRVEREVASQSSFVVSVDDRISGHMDKSYPGVTTRTISNGYWGQSRSKVAGSPSPFEADVFNLVYTGSLFTGVPVEALVGALSRSYDRPICFHFYGQDAERAGLHFLHLEKLGILTNHGLVPRPEALVAQYHADLLVAGFAPSREGVLSGKLPEYFAAGRPILAYGCPPGTLARKEIERLGVGMAVENDQEEIAQAISRFIADSPVNRKDPPPEYSWDSLGQKWLELLSTPG